VLEKVALMLGFSGHLAGNRPIGNDPGADSRKKDEFSTRKTCFKNRLAISDEPVCRRQNWAGFSD